MSSNPSLSLVDTHCHLNLDDFNSDRVQVVERAFHAGVHRILVPGIDVMTSQSAIECARQFSPVYAAVGVHPNSSADWTNDMLLELKRLSSEPKVVAIGEIGLDYYRNRAPRDTQRRVLQGQLDLAAELGLPVIIHNREASDEIIDILEKWHAGLVNNGLSLANHPGVLHSFSGDIHIADRALLSNFKLGITGPVSFRNAQVLQSVVSSVPLECLLIETDAPYLAPHPFRGKRNEPANVRIVAEKIAELKQVTVDVVASRTADSADQLFNWRSIH